TAVAQPLLVATGIATALLLGDLPSDAVLVGHSIGELTAAAVAGVLDAESAVALAQERGRAMAAAADAEPSGMTAVLGGDPDGAVVSDGVDFRDRLVGQVTRPVRFDECLRTMRSLGVTATVEVAPGGVLTGLVRRELPDVTAVALRTPDDIDAASRLVAAHRV